MAKPAAGIYEPNKRVMFKVKHERECDCVVAGFRWHASGEKTAVGSLLLGLYDDGGKLQHVGVAASFTADKRIELVELLAPYRENALVDHPWQEWAAAQQLDAEGHRVPGVKSRWSQGKDLSWEPLRAELVAEVAYEHMQGDALPPHRALSSLAPRQEPARLHLRAARGRRPPRARRASSRRDDERTAAL